MPNVRPFLVLAPDGTVLGTVWARDETEARGKGEAWWAIYVTARAQT